MTAVIVYSMLREEAENAEDLEWSATKPQAAENHRHDIPGQLWQRVAERTRPDYDAYPWKALDAVVHFHDGPGRPVCIAGLGFRGTLGRHVCGDHHSHGIIRAGKRVK